MGERDRDLRSRGSILLISCYELGRQPLGVASPLAFLEGRGFAPDVMDIAVEAFDEEKVARARFIGISVPMHTAMRLGLRVAERAREINADCHIAFYGLYATLNASFLLERVADSCIGGEFEGPLVDLVEAIEAKRLDPAGSPEISPEGVVRRGESPGAFLAHLYFKVPSRAALPDLDAYARLEHDGERRIVGHIETSRGCKHRCKHCPIPPVYDGQFFTVPREIVLEDVRRQVAAGARHITFGDPDFLNGPTHSLRIARALHDEFPQLTFDFTAKVEHIILHADLFPELADLGCLFMISAVESLSTTVLANLVKGHDRDDVHRAFDIVHSTGIALRPTWVAFTPWTTRTDYLEMLEFIDDRSLIGHVDPVQFSIRLLVPPGSYLCESSAMQPYLGALEQEAFIYRWDHPDPRMDRLHKDVAALVEQDAAANEDTAETFYRIWSLAADGEPVPAGRTCHADHGLFGERVRPPRISEPWFC